VCLVTQPDTAILVNQCVVHIGLCYCNHIAGKITPGLV